MCESHNEITTAVPPTKLLCNRYPEVRLGYEAYALLQLTQCPPKYL